VTFWIEQFGKIQHFSKNRKEKYQTNVTRYGFVSENQELETMHEFNHETSKICINCFIDKQLFWTYDYQHWNDIPNEDKKLK